MSEILDKANEHLCIMKQTSNPWWEEFESLLKEAQKQEERSEYWYSKYIELKKDLPITYYLGV
jgi:hypothetical protein